MVERVLWLEARLREFMELRSSAQRPDRVQFVIDAYMEELNSLK